MKTRYYDSSIGRFTTRDRFAGFENDSDSQNRYVYCQNDPVGNVDPIGYYPWYVHASIAVITVKSTLIILRKATWLSLGAKIYKGVMAAIALLETSKYLIIAAQFFVATIFIVSALAVLASITVYYNTVKDLWKHVRYASDFGSWHSRYWDHN